MKILLIHQMFLEDDDPGGSRFNEMTKVWTGLGHEVTVLAGMMHYNGHAKRPEYKRRYVVSRQQGASSVWRCHVSESYNTHFVGRLWAYFSFLFSATWAGLFKVKGEFDIILVTSPPLFDGIIAYVLSRFKKIPYVFEVRDLWPYFAIETGVLTNKWIIRLAYVVESFLYKHAEGINVLTPAFRKHLVSEKHVAPDKIFFIPNAADFSLSENQLDVLDIPAFRKSLGWEDRFVVTYVGAHGLANGLGQILDVAERLRDIPVLFVLIGDGMVREKLMEEAKAKGILNVQFIQAVPKSEIFSYIAASDMGASVLKNVPAFKTVYSNKTFDYMACAKPVLMLIDGVSRDLIEDADAGVYAEPENPIDCEKVLRNCLNDPEKLIRQGQNGYAYVKKHFDRRALSESYIDELQKHL